MTENTSPMLTLTPDMANPNIKQPGESTKPNSAAPATLEENLTAEELAQIKDFAQQIDIANSNQILMYGAAPQKNIAEFSDAALASVRTKDLGEIGNMIGDLIVELKGFSAVETEKKGLLGIFKKSFNKITALKAKYDKAEVNVDKICGLLEGHQVQLLKDISMLDKMYNRNLDYLKELSMYILAGKQRLEQAKSQELPQMLEKAQQSNLPEDAQAANDFAALIDRFEKKIHDLDLTRTISLQMSPQIRLVQNNDALMAEKIQSSLVNTIPLWKSQMVLALGLAHSEQAIKAQREVTDLTNELLKKNAETLKTSTIATAKEAERGIVDIETLTQTNRLLIETLDEVVRIQDDGRAKRMQAEQELRQIEGQLKQRLLQVNSEK